MFNQKLQNVKISNKFIYCPDWMFQVWPGGLPPTSLPLYLPLALVLLVPQRKQWFLGFLKQLDVMAGEWWAKESKAHTIPLRQVSLWRCSLQSIVLSTGTLEIIYLSFCFLIIRIETPSSLQMIKSNLFLVFFSFYIIISISWFHH